MTQETVSLSIDQLRAGATCRHAIEDTSGSTLIEANTELTEQTLAQLRQRDIQTVKVDRRDLPELHTDPNSLQADEVQRNAGEWDDTRPVKEFMVDRHHEGLDEKFREKLLREIKKSTAMFENLKTRIAEEQVESVQDFHEICQSFATFIVQDHDQTVAILGNPGKDSSPEERSIQLSVLGMALAIELELHASNMLEVGLAGLLHDVGLYAMDCKFRRPVDAMNQSERWEYRKHPLLSAVCLGEAQSVSQEVKLAIQQVHEQFDGSGFPRGVHKHRIHLYARILNVVDCYLQLIRPDMNQNSLVPHDALGLMLHQASNGLFDPQVMRGFLNMKSLFPLGSMVELSSGVVARVIRRPRAGFADPVVEDLDGNRIELETSELSVVRPFCNTEFKHLRLLPDLMAASKWHPANHATI